MFKGLIFFSILSFVFFCFLFFLFFVFFGMGIGWRFVGVGLGAEGTYFSQLRVQNGCVDKVFELALFRFLDRRVNHVEAHHGLPVRKRRFNVVDDGRILDDPLRFLGQAEVGGDDFCVRVLALEALLGLGRVAD